MHVHNKNNVHDKSQEIKSVEKTVLFQGLRFQTSKSVQVCIYSKVILSSELEIFDGLSIKHIKRLQAFAHVSLQKWGSTWCGSVPITPMMQDFFRRRLNSAPGPILMSI